jgi:hypothetical protein
MPTYNKEFSAFTLLFYILLAQYYCLRRNSIFFQTYYPTLFQDLKVGAACVTPVIKGRRSAILLLVSVEC